MFSRRTNWSLAPNRLASALEARRRGGKEIVDLTISNPTLAGFEYPSKAIGAALAEGASHPYDPEPKGGVTAREAVARWYASRGLAASADQIVLTASTSEGYAWLFKLLCDPGDRVLIPRPSYPLFEFLATLESVVATSYPLRYETRWGIDLDALEGLLGDAGASETLRAGASGVPRTSCAPNRETNGSHTPGSASSASSAAGGLTIVPHARALVLVNPNNPTGSLLSRAELVRLSALARRRELVLISDEVFSTYLFDTIGSPDRITSLIGTDEAPAFVLDGLSKSAGLPGIKAGWIVVSGPPEFRETALSRLEVIADTFLSVGNPAQRALPRLIELGELVAGHIRARIRTNHAWFRTALEAGSSCQLLEAEGGWSAILRVPRTVSEEELCLALLEEDGVLVQPGWFFDFDSEAYLVISLLTPEPSFREGLFRILARAG